MKNSISNVGKRTAISFAISSALISGAAYAAEADSQISASDKTETISVKGIRSSLKQAMFDKKQAVIVSDGIAAEDLGKFPDLNVAESLQRITGVSIDRSGGEGQSVTVRGFGPQFNTVLVNGRQFATENPGREFSFDLLAAEQITGADVFKSANSKLQTGGIGSTINVSTARPFDNPGFQAVGSVKAMYETLNGETSPAFSGLVSNTFADGKFGALIAVSHQKRDVQLNRLETSGYRPGITLTRPNGDVLETDVYIPRNLDMLVDEQERTRTNTSVSLQYAPNEDLTLTLDGFHSKYEVDSRVRDLAAWFEPNRVTDYEIGDNRTVVFFDQVGGAATDFVDHTRNKRDVTTTAFGLNADWQITDNLKAIFDVSTSNAENNVGGKTRFNVIGIPNTYSFDTRSGKPIATHNGINGDSLLPSSAARAHYNERAGNNVEDTIVEYKADFEYRSDSDLFRGMNYGIYRQEREKTSERLFSDAGCAFCGYEGDIPDDLLQKYTVDNFFSGVTNTFYSYDGEAYFDYLDTPEALVAQDTGSGKPAGTAAAAYGNGFVPVRQGDAFAVEEEINGAYVDFNFAGDIDDMPVSVNFGVRYEETSTEMEGIQSNLVDITTTNDPTLFSNTIPNSETLTQSSSYSNLLPSLNVKLELESDLILRFAIYDSITRPTLTELSPTTVFGEPRRQNLTANGGNPDLRPFKSENWDVSLEWYYADTSSLSIAVFNKDVKDFIVTTPSDERFDLTGRVLIDGETDTQGNPLYLCADCDVNEYLANPAEFESVNGELVGSSEAFFVSRPRNGEEARVFGLEAAWTHTWDSGFGFTANATIVNNTADSSGESSFALEGLGDSQNLILFYENDSFQTRLAYNNREGFLQTLANGVTGEPVSVETYGQWDISASYDINDNINVFFEGINITEEEVIKHGRFANQIVSVEDNGARFAVGVRGSF